MDPASAVPCTRLPVPMSEPHRGRDASADRRLWEAAGSGDAAAAERLLQRVRVEARAWLGRLGLPTADREDLLSEVQLSVLRLLRSGEPAPRNLGGFLYFRSRAVTSRYLRRARVRGARRELSPALELADLGPGPGEEAHRDALCAASRECRDALPDVLRRVLRMRYEEELSQAAIGRLLQRSDVWVHRRVRQGLALLATCLRSKGWMP